MPRGIIGVDNNHAARAGCDRLLQGVKINLPAVVIDQGIAHEPYVLNIGEKAEKRIARLGDQDFVTRIAERPKNKGIGLAGAGSENDLLNRNLISPGGVVCGNGPASCFEALWLGLVLERGWTAERLQDGLPIVVESACRGVRGSSSCGQRTFRPRLAAPLRSLAPQIVTIQVDKSDQSRNRACWDSASKVNTSRAQNRCTQRIPRDCAFSVAGCRHGTSAILFLEDIDIQSYRWYLV